MAHSFSHIVNPVGRNENAELFKTQLVTIDSFKRAKSATSSGIEVESIAVVTPHNGEAGAFADKTVFLERTVSDLHKFNQPRSLPLVSDLLDIGVACASGEYVVFTNSDIILTPWFYNCIAEFIDRGHDALVVNRRRIPVRLANQSYEVMLAHAGYAHNGYDCFVFKKSLYGKFVKSGICIGIPMAGNDIFYNIFTHAENPALLANQHLTFHLGLELVKAWGTKEYVDYNYREFTSLLRKLKPAMSISKFPGSGLPFFKRHFRWLMNPTYDYKTMCALDFSQWSQQRPAVPPKEISGLRSRYYEWLQRQVNFRDND